MTQGMLSLFLTIIIVIPFLLTVLNILAFGQFLVKKREKRYYKIVEVISMWLGILYLHVYGKISGIKFVSWDVQIYSTELHSMISPDSMLTIVTISLIAFVGYVIVRFIPAAKQPPLVSAIGIAAIYLGIGICLLWCIQTKSHWMLLILPVNIIIIYIKTILILVYEKNKLLQNGEATTKYKRLSSILNKAINLPWISLILAIPLLGIIITILLLFGQEPNSIIKAWTETADWTMSQKIPPQSIGPDEHYLCTVAAGGHRKVVKPIRTGLRHGHRVVVNRQLCIANAFEQVLEEKVPAIHKVVRGVYDSFGYPISKHIHSKYLADAIYFIMKPLEWIFLLVLYSVDVNPEDRIAVQYPHRSIN